MTAASRYSLGATDAELRRLIDLATHEEDRVIDACRRAGIGDGCSVIDFGCGPLGALSALERVVGPSGSVTGIDASATALEKARRLLPPHVRLVQGDLHEIALDQPVDLAYFRLVLLHQSDPGHTLRRVARLVRSGGVVIAHEPSDQIAHGPSSEPHVPATWRVWELVIAAARALGARTDFAARGREHLEQAGFVVESHRAYAVHYPPEIGYEIPRVALRSLRPVLEERGLASPDEVEQLDRELEDAKQRRGVQWVSSPLMFEWIGRKR